MKFGSFFKISAGEKFELKNMIKAKNQLVLSRNFCDSSAFEATLYSFGGGEGITWQAIPNDLILFVVEGEPVLEAKLEDRKILREKGKEGEALFIKNGNEFQISGEKPYKLCFFGIKNKNISDKNGGQNMFIKNFVQGKVVSLKDQIEVEEGTIASKTLVNRDDLTMTIFAFDAGQGVSTHSAAGDAFVVCLDGKAEITLNGEKLTIEKGQSLIMPANAPHAVKAVSQYKMLLTVVKA